MKYKRMNLTELRELVSKLRLDELEERRIVMPLLLRRILELEAEVQRLNELIEKMSVSKNPAQVAKKEA